MVKLCSDPGRFRDGARRRSLVPAAGIGLTIFHAIDDAFTCRRFMTVGKPNRSAQKPLTPSAIIQDEIAALKDRIERLQQAASAHVRSEEQARMVKDLIDARRRRDALFAADLFGEPAWDMLLELYLAELEDRTVRVSKLGAASGISQSTALRWLGKLERDGWIHRVADPAYGRREFAVLTARSLSAMQAYVEESP